MIFYTVMFQMFSLLIMIGTGYVATKKGMLDNHTNQQMSKMIANVFNPLLAVSSAAGSVGLISFELMVKVAGIAVAMFICFIILGMILTPFFTKDNSERKLYQLMFVFSNLGFIGIPVVSTVLGSQYVVYVAEFILIYSIVLYSYGVAVLEGKFSLKSMKKMINSGTIAGLSAVAIIIFEIRLPEFIGTAVTYLGNVASPLALVTVGFNAAQSDLKKIFCQPKLYIFSVVKLLVIPLLLMPLLHLFKIDGNTTAVCMIIFGMPVGNMPLILANEKGIECFVYSLMIILSTVLCVISIPILVTLMEMGII